MGLGAREIVVVPNPVSSPLGAFAGERSGVLYVGRLSPEKGLDVLVHALQGLTGMELHVAGEGPLRKELEALALRLGVAATFWGWLDPDRVASLMGSAAILCMPSTCYENCPSAVLEAMSAGLPVVASDLGGLTELLDDGRCGLLFPAGDVAGLRTCFERALASPPELSAMAQRAQVRAATRHDPERFLDRIEGTYASLIG
jgi:glycosyltransferase involved in cell wall biosynthesis